METRSEAPHEATRPEAARPDLPWHDGAGRRDPPASRRQRAGRAASLAPPMSPGLSGHAPARPPAGASYQRAPGESTLARMLEHHVAPELFCLGAVELVVCAALMYLLLAAGQADAPTVHWGGLQLAAANQAALLALIVGLTSFAIGLYSPETHLRTRQLLVSTAVAGVLAAAAVGVVGWVLGISVPALQTDPQLPLQLLGVWVGFLFITRLSFSWALRANLFVRRVLIIGTDQAAARVAATIKSLRRGFFEVISVLPASEAGTLTPQAVAQRRIWGIIVTSEAAAALPADRLERIRELGVHVYDDVQFWERQLRRIDVEQVRDWRVDAALAHGNPAPDTPAPVLAPDLVQDAWDEQPAEGPGARLAEALNRAGDIALSLAFLVATAPLMLLTAIAIRLDSPGPIIYRQERVGLHGRVFQVLKFRSMRTDAEARGPVWAMTCDPRVTRVGKVIRLLRIDELPQLVNVLRGEMSFIGPRPERPHFVKDLAEAIPHYSQRSLVKPGLTGWAQVNYPYGASIEDARAKLSYDLYYIKHRGLLLNLLILFSTVRVILFQKGAR